MSGLVPYSIQSQSLTCSIWDKFNSYIVPYAQWILNMGVVGSKIWIKLNPVAGYVGQDQLNQSVRKNSLVALFGNDLFSGGVNAAFYASKYSQNINCAQYEIDYQNKKSQISLKLIELINAGKESCLNLSIEEGRSYTWLYDNYKRVYTNLAESQSSDLLISAASNLLKKYFPNEKLLDNDYSLELKQVETYFHILSKKIKASEIQVTNREKKAIDVWNHLFETIK